MELEFFLIQKHCEHCNG